MRPLKLIPDNTNIRFLRYRNIAITISALLIIASIALCVVRGFNLGIEAAQVALVLVTMPALFMLGGGRLLLWLGSAAAGAAGVWWLWSGLARLLW